MIESSSPGVPAVGEQLMASLVTVGPSDPEFGGREPDVAGPQHGASRVPSSHPLPLREVRSEVLRAVLARLVDATDLAAAASAVAACRPSFVEVARVHLLDRMIEGDDDQELVPGAELRVRTPARSAVEGARGGFRPRRALTRGSLLREAMESQHAVCHAGLEPLSARPVADDLDQGFLAGAPAGGERLAVPLLCGRRTIGVLVLVRGPGRPRFTASDVETAEQLATMTALRLDNLRLSSRQDTTAHALRDALRPVVPSTLTGVRVGVGYRPARRGDDVGGDWVEAIALPGGRTAFTVGDVMGHGTRAAVIMGLLRSAIQALAPLHLDPAQVLRQLDDLAEQHQAARPEQANWLATCLYAVYNPVTRECAMASAGHLPPVLTGPDGRSRLLDVEPGAPIGVGGVPFRTVWLPIPDGSQLTLFTDGLVEVRGQDIDEGTTALRRRVSAGVVRPIDRACQDLLDRAPAGDHPDDVALLVARMHGLPADRVPVLA